jgi:hypothetical protein
MHLQEHAYRTHSLVGDPQQTNQVSDENILIRQQIFEPLEHFQVYKAI